MHPGNRELFRYKGPPLGGDPPPSTPRPGPEAAGAPGFWNDERMDMLEPYRRFGRMVGPAASAVAVPAAALIPAAIAALNAGDTYGDAGGVVSGAASLAGGSLGGALGSSLGALAAGHRRGGYGLRTAGGVVGALMGAGMGAGAGGLVNTAAKAAVDKADSGQPGMISDIGRALDELGYRSTADIETARLNQMAASPAYRAIQQQQLLNQATNRSNLAEQLYLQALATPVRAY